MLMTSLRGAARGASILGLLLGAAGAQAQVLSNDLLFTSIQPCRIFDTRVSSGGTGPIAANSNRTFNVVGSNSADFTSQGGHAGGCAIPGFFMPQGSAPVPQAQAVLVNLVSVAPQGAGDLRAWPTDQAEPFASVLNYSNLPGLNLANAIVLPVRQDQQGQDVTLRADVAGTEVVADVVGYFTNNIRTNLALGLGSFQSETTGTFNVALGPSTLTNDMTGNFNTGVGASALHANTSGTLNTGVGSGSLADLDGAGDNLAVGANSLMHHFNMGNDNVAIGAGALMADQLGNANVAVGFQAGSTQNDSNKLYIGGATTGPPLIYGDFSAGRLAIVTGTGAPAAPQATLEVQGTALVDALGSGSVCASASGGLSNCSPSDARLKRNVVGLGNEVDLFAALAGLRGVAFSWDTAQPRARQLGAQREIGLIAQEVERVLPQIVSTHPDGYKSVDYSKLSAFLVEVVKSEQADLDAQETTLARQQQGIEALHRQLLETFFRPPSSGQQCGTRRKEPKP